MKRFMIILAALIMLCACLSFTVSADTEILQSPESETVERPEEPTLTPSPKPDGGSVSPQTGILTGSALSKNAGNEAPSTISQGDVWIIAGIVAVIAAFFAALSIKSKKNKKF